MPHIHDPHYDRVSLCSHCDLVDAEVRGLCAPCAHDAALDQDDPAGADAIASDFGLAPAACKGCDQRRAVRDNRGLCVLCTRHHDAADRATVATLRADRAARCPLPHERGWTEAHALVARGAA